MKDQTFYQRYYGVPNECPHCEEPQAVSFAETRHERQDNYAGNRDTATAHADGRCPDCGKHFLAVTERVRALVGW